MLQPLPPYHGGVVVWWYGGRVRVLQPLPPYHGGAVVGSEQLQHTGRQLLQQPAPRQGCSHGSTCTGCGSTSAIEIIVPTMTFNDHDIGHDRP